MLELAGIRGVELPGRMAPINEVLNVLSPRVREQMLIYFMSELYVLPDTAA